MKFETIPITKHEGEPTPESKTQENLPVSKEKDSSYSTEIAEINDLRQETIRFEGHWNSIIGRLEKLKGPKRAEAAKNYIENIDEVSIQLQTELNSVKWELEKYIRYTRVGDFIESLKSSSSISSGLEIFKEEHIPPVNIPAIITLCARMAALQEKISLLKETKVLVSGYEISDDYRFAKDHLGKILKNIESPHTCEVHFQNLISYCGSVGADISYLGKAMKYQKEGRYDDARNELYQLDKQLTEFFNGE